MARSRRLRPAHVDSEEDLDDLGLLLLRQDGVVGRRQALGLLSRAAIEHRLIRGTWRLVHRSVYLVGGGSELTADQRRWVASLAGGVGRPAYLAGLSALQMLGLRVGESHDHAPVHILIPSRYRDHDPPSFVVTHRTGVLPDADVVDIAAPPRTTAARAVLDAAQWADSDQQAAMIVTAAFTQRLVDHEEVAAVASRLTRARRRALVLDIAGDMAGGSVPETQFCRLCRRIGLPTPRCAIVRADAEGQRHYLDATFEEYGVRVEVDGGRSTGVDGEPDARSAAWWADVRQRDDACVAGRRLLRFPAWVVRHYPDEVATRVRAALKAAGWPARPGRCAVSLKIGEGVGREGDRGLRQDGRHERRHRRHARPAPARRE